MAGKGHPQSVTGGCLCGAVRYTLSFGEEGSWPPGVSGVFSSLSTLYIVPLAVKKASGLERPHIACSVASLQRLGYIARDHTKL